MTLLKQISNITEGLDIDSFADELYPPDGVIYELVFNAAQKKAALKKAVDGSRFKHAYFDVLADMTRPLDKKQKTAVNTLISKLEDCCDGQRKNHNELAEISEVKELAKQIKAAIVNK